MEKISDIKMRYVLICQRLFDVRIKLYKIAMARWENLLKDPGALDVFSSETIIFINTTRRQIPKLIEQIELLKSQISIENFALIDSGEIREQLNKLDADLKRTSDLITTYEAKLPKFKSGLFAWFFLPFPTLKFYVGGFWHKIRMKWFRYKKKK